MDNMYQEAIKNLSYKARQRGANAIVGIKIDFDEISGQGKQMFMLCVTGTAVNILKKSFQQIRTIPIIKQSTNILSKWNYNGRRI